MRRICRPMALIGALGSAAVGLACEETPIWTSEPIPLMRAIALRDVRLVRECVDGGQDLNTPRPLADAGLSHAGGWPAGSVLTPLELAVALEQPGLAGLLIDLGAEPEGVATPLLCLTAFHGAPSDLVRLRAKGLTISPTLRCETPEADTLEALARRNSDAMVAALQAVPPGR